MIYCFKKRLSHSSHENTGPMQTCGSSVDVSNGSRFVKSHSHPQLLLYSK